MTRQVTPVRGPGIIDLCAGGRRVVEPWGGIADRRTGSLWNRDTAAVMFSCSRCGCGDVGARARHLLLALGHVVGA
jgi:hypothetical protein